ncbi:Putative hydrolase of the HD superfamily (permuted catalytic motifs) [Gloeomargarita lithophora Alchichica-D10]|uniref:Hydrolase of the HD superfamily (Permuted catalytic motifs) n=1 Tax=Gloeomargarita lithophora Alchichica-D10 TaxID=1188229 RepID=A0A1J0AAI3_9CYAN|nr:type III-B CRISPR-associated protein Cas10/Cmr2 [Gloeomargarita lithophora]APB32942.1 Putative hydrolase of the HD superfamily (permuted catalytic motifs) [Gloeomargarita lithophora Alchichica-D10]
MTFTVMTFAPVQGFIERSRKLRDLYGSSFILSHLARALCEAGQSELGGADTLVSPALINVTQGTPNQIILAGNFPEIQGRRALLKAWKEIVDQCRTWIEAQIPAEYTWKRHWELWGNHAWEFFWGQGETITAAREEINRAKRSRDWVGINWQGESSTLSGADAIAWPGLGRKRDSRDIRLGEDDREIREFYKKLQSLTVLGEAFVDATEQLSIPELIKRLVTYHVVAKRIGIQGEVPDSFRDIKLREQRTFWFAGDGDKIGEYFRQLKENGQDESTALRQFSQAMLEWGENTLKPAVDGKLGRIVYAGGDDFLGVLYPADTHAFSPQASLAWFYERFPQIWRQHGQDIKVSVGAVLAGKQVPQRDILQQAREAEKSAKKQGRDRIALRVLFNGGNHIEWVCPWDFLPPIFANYHDRDNGKNWTHIYNDVAVLASRRGLASPAVAFALFEVYFGAENRQTLEQNPSHYIGTASVSDWVNNLAQVGFQLCSNT